MIQEQATLQLKYKKTKIKLNKTLTNSKIEIKIFWNTEQPLTTSSEEHPPK
jgi:hypothetical protein